jgi:CHAT domain-containing protein
VNSTGSLEPPPGALAEADKVAEQFTHAVTLSGNKARRASVEKEIVRSSIFHFAGHATGGRAGTEMLLADGSLAVAGRLSVYGHHSMPARDNHALGSLKLAVLSACGTAKPGEIAQSSSLVAEFLHAGTSNVVASRWNVDSMATTDFMIQFYRSVLSGQPVAVALQITAGEFRKIPGRAHPYYWAAFSAFSNS